MKKMSRILIVDDDAELRFNVREILEDNGFEVEEAASGKEAMQRLTDNSFEVVLLDVMMPGLTGTQMLPQLRETAPWTKIIMITAFASVESAVESIKQGADDYISKPFRIEELLTAVRKSVEEIKFNYPRQLLNMDHVFNSLSNKTRRDIIYLLREKGIMKFMEITRELNIEDHTKVSFHLKDLKEANLIEQDEKKHYRLSQEGRKICECLATMKKNLMTIK